MKKTIKILLIAVGTALLAALIGLAVTGYEIGWGRVPVQGMGKRSQSDRAAV